MNHTYWIKGMTCEGCSTSVKSKLGSVPGVFWVEVNLNKGEATIDLQRHILLSELQASLPEKYTILEKTEGVRTVVKGDNDKSDWERLFPLFLILGYISTASFLMNREVVFGTGFMLDFMGLFYIVFSFFKMLDLKGFPESFRMYDPVAKNVPGYAVAYPFLETALGLMFLMRFQIPIALVMTIVVLGITTIGVAKVLLDRQSIQCACLGTVLKLPMTKATIIENTIMIVMAIVMLLSNP
ncbi:MauE/DoxX family redox-associated membrane protein [Flavobacterium sp.]|uniref:heavy-metal-associated domain-containing protein n=1 Tax=Flavobacterium sp. TaxID=239 RepID=UPI002614724D|nr:MauE/DoxX family redox-associated membrane protein [Flavobacterium sp.]